MSASLYDFSVGSYQHILTSTAQILAKSREHFEAQDVDLGEVVAARLHDDMMPLHFQIVSVAHHSIGALKGIKSGVFTTPSFELDKDYQGLQDLVSDAIAGLDEFTEENVNASADGDLVFKIGKNSLPFVAEEFIRTFSLPNFYFHATTTYDILRMKGAPLGKMDYLGGIRTKK
jgi:hypothetical protein